MSAQHPRTPAQPAKRATIIDVAARAGVSKSLVSLAFKDPKRVSEQRLERIRSAAAELNYSPSFVAQTLTSQQSPFIGILILDFQNPLFINALHLPIAKGLLEAGKHVLCKKPLAGTLEDAEATVELEKQYGDWLITAVGIPCAEPPPSMPSKRKLLTATLAPSPVSFLTTCVTMAPTPTPP